MSGKPKLDAILGPIRFAEPHGAGPEMIESVRQRNRDLPRGHIYAEIGQKPMVTEAWWTNPGIRISAPR